MCMQSLPSGRNVQQEACIVWAGAAEAWHCACKAHHACMHAAIGSRVKFLVDTPESLWGLLDSRQPLVAARRLRGAMLVHEKLQAERPQTLARQFPLLRNRWAAADGKRQDILACADDVLRTTTRLDKVRLDTQRSWAPVHGARTDE
jgi:hypothetical protein